MYCPNCGTKLPERHHRERTPVDPASHIPLQSLVCPKCEAPIQIDDRRDRLQLPTPIVTILLV